MQTPVQITFRHMAPSEAVRARVLDLIERLEHFNDSITGCQVVIEAPAGHSRHGAPFEVKVDLQVPGHNLHVCSDPGPSDWHTDVYLALRDVFDNVKRKLHELRS